VHVWGAITSDAKSELVILSGPITRKTYKHLLENRALPFARRHLGDRFYYQDDNARPHRAQLVEDLLASERIQRLSWPPLSPDMNPIEHIWEELGRRINNQRRSYSTLQELQQSLQQHWDTIPQQRIRHLIDGMPRRVQAVLKSHGEYTPY